MCCVGDRTFGKSLNGLTVLPEGVDCYGLLAVTEEQRAVLSKGGSSKLYCTVLLQSETCPQEAKRLMSTEDHGFSCQSST